MKIESRNEGRGILIHRQILSVDEYQEVIRPISGKRRHTFFFETAA